MQILFIQTKGNPSYSGENCEIVLCNEIADPEVCNDFSRLDCLKIQVFYYCPRLCGYCKATTTSTTSLSKATTLTTTKKCSQLLPCLNGAKQDPISCKCDCIFKL